MTTSLRMSCAIALLTIVAGAASAQPVDKRTLFTFNQPVALPGVTLPASTYLFRLANPDTSQNVAHVLSADGKKAYAMFFVSRQRKLPIVRGAAGQNPSLEHGPLHSAFVDPVDRDANPKRLRSLAEASGGESFEPRAIAEVTGVLQTIARDIRNTYTIGYVPTNTARGARMRRLRVVVTGENGRELRVRARHGYVAEER